MNKDNVKCTTSDRESGNVFEEILDKIMKQREEILNAFIAKYGYSPEECEQIIENHGNLTVFYVRKKKYKE